MAIEYFCCYHSYLEVMEELNDAEKGRLFTACLTYSKTGESPQLCGNERFVFPTFRAQIDRDNSRYDKKCQKQAENAKKRWHANECDGMPDDANLAKDAKTKTKTKTKEKTKDNINTPLSPLFGEELQKAFDDWLEYKRERREGYKPTGLKALESEIRNNAAVHGESEVAKLIRSCMAAGWKGIAFDRLGAKQSAKPKSMGPTCSSAYSRGREALNDGRSEAERIRENNERLKRLMQQPQKEVNA